MIKVTFPDGGIREYAEGTTAMQIAESISPRLAQEVLSASVNGEIVDLNRPIVSDAQIKLHKWEDPEGKKAFWHSSSHLMAEALEALYPGIKFGIGPAIENGFYYDVDSRPRSPRATCRKSKRKWRVGPDQGGHYATRSKQGRRDEDLHRERRPV